MFRKVQLKFFAIITSILLAIFIAILLSINLIMRSVMERQSREVLEQVAAGVEYDENIKDFTFKRPNDPRFNKDFPTQERPKPEEEPKTDVPASQPAESTTAVSTTYPSTETTTTTVSTVNETTISHPEPEQPHKEPPPEEPPAPNEPPQETSENIAPQTENTVPDTTIENMVVTEPPQTSIPNEEKTEIILTDIPNNIEADNDDDNDDDDKKFYEKKYERSEWWKHPEWEHEWENNHDIPWNPYEAPKKGIMPTSYNFYEPVLDGYTIVALSETSETEKSEQPNIDEPPPDMKFMDDRGNLPKALGTTEFFVIMADKDGNLLKFENNEDLTDSTAQKYINAVMGENSTEGMLMNRYQYISVSKSNGTLIVFTDKNGELDMLRKLMRTTIIIGAFSIVILSAASYFLSGIIVKPIKDAFGKQKQFISDASHELKTPLAVISANADVLSEEIGHNKWLEYIQDQIGRMNILVNELLNLTRLENSSNKIIFTKFNASHAIENTALPFECSAFEAGRNFEINIEENIEIVGSEQHIKQMTAIFIDNALKYSDEGGTVRITLKKQGEKCLLSIFNTGTGVKESEKEKIFERFYRSDESRNRSTGGYGLGLSIAKSIIDKHRFKLSIDNKEGESICFNILM